MINKCQDRKKVRVNFKHNKECMLSLKKTMLKLALFNVFNTENHIIHTYTQNIKGKKNLPTWVVFFSLIFFLVQGQFQPNLAQSILG